MINFNKDTSRCAHKIEILCSVFTLVPSGHIMQKAAFKARFLHIFLYARPVTIQLLLSVSILEAKLLYEPEFFRLSLSHSVTHSLSKTLTQ